MAPITRAQEKKAIEDERDEFRRQLGEMTAQRDNALAQLDEMKIAYELLRQENHSMARQIKVLNEKPLSAQSNGNPIAVGGTVASLISQSEPTTSALTLPTTISSLPNEMLANIFSYLSQQDMCQVLRVCRLWNSQLPIVISKVRSISLMVCHLVPYDDYYQFKNQHMSKLASDDCSTIHAKYRFDQQSFNLHYTSLVTKNVNDLVEKFPAIVTLRVTINERSYNMLDYVMELIRKWSSKLTTLELSCAFTENDCSELSNKVLDLFKVINSLPVLKHLTVELRHSLYKKTGSAVQRVDHQFQSMDVEPRFEMPILARLHEFNFGVWESIECTPLYHLLSQFGPTNQQLTHIRLYTWNDAQTFETFATLCPTVAPRITFLPSDSWPVSALQPLLPHYPSLTEVNICLSSTSLKYYDIVNMLSPLRQLIHLKLNFDLSASTPGVDNPAPYRAAIRLSQLTTVKMLTLTKYVHEASVVWFSWYWALPNVQIVKLSPNHSPRHLSTDKSYCRTLLECPKLNRVYFLEQQENAEATKEVWTEWVVVKKSGKFEKEIRKVQKL